MFVSLKRQKVRALSCLERSFNGLGEGEVGMRIKIVVLGLFLFLIACQDQVHADSAQQVKQKMTNPVVVFATNHGDIAIELYADRAPISTANLLAYVESGFYTGIIFHRVIPGFMLQAGGFDAQLTRRGPLRPTIKNEADNGLSNVRGSVAMARSQQVDSASSQFFINLVDNSRLDHRSKDSRGYGYAVVGKVIEGMDVADKIASQPTLCPSSKRQRCEANLPTGMRDVPAEAVIFNKVSLRKVK